jgi:hypothetical protein
MQFLSKICVWRGGSTVKKVCNVFVPSRDVTNQTLLGLKKINYSRPGSVSLETFRLGTGKSQTFF